MRKKIAVAAIFAVVCAAALLLGHIRPDYNVIMFLRLPRMLAALICGAALGLSGTLFQGVLKNPLADPYLLGTSAGASAAAALCFVCGIGRMSPLFFISVFAGAFCATFLSYFIARAAGRLSDASLVLSGVAVSAFLTALLMLCIKIGEEKAISLYGFIMGQFYSPSYPEIIAAGTVFVISIAAAYLHSRHLDAFSLGEEKAYHLGADPEKGRLFFFIIASTSSAAAVAMFGTVGFVGLMAPHIMRMIFSPLGRVLIPMSAIGGAIMLCAADTVGRVILSPMEIPAGIIMALCGAPFFLWLLFLGGNSKKSHINFILKKKQEKIKIEKKQQKKEKVEKCDKNFNTCKNEGEISKTVFLQAKNISFGYGNEFSENEKNTCLFKNLSFELDSGDFLGILGPNGAGKSTLLRLAGGYITNDEEIYVWGKRARDYSSSDLAKKIAWLPGEIGTPYDFTVRDFAELGRCAKNGFSNAISREDVRKSEEAMSAAGILHLKDRIVNSLSSGEKQLACLAQALAQDSDILLLDEPVSHLDLYYKERFMDIVLNLVVNRNKAAVAVLHEPALAVFCNRILLLGRGWHYLGSPEDALRPSMLARLYGISENSKLI